MEGKINVTEESVLKKERKGSGSIFFFFYLFDLHVRCFEICATV